MKLKDKIAVVTGAGMGIGRGIALKFAEEGAHVIVNDIIEDALKETVQMLENVSKHKVFAHVGDISAKDQVDSMFDIVTREFGQIDLLVNNAGWTQCNRHFMEYDEEFWDKVIRINLKSVYLTTRKAAEMMVQRREGAIINLSSIGATKAHRQMVAYDASKGAIDAFTRATALDLGPWNIRVNAIAPAVIVGTPVKKMDDEILARQNPADFGTPLLRQGWPEDIANCALFLASSDSSFMTGQILAVDGGLGVQARPYPKP